MTKPRLLAISGSLRASSYNTAILRTLADAAADRADITLFPLNDVPLYDQDIDTETPLPAIAALREATAAADGIIIASPEYNYGMSGVLKNALDWASRPYGKSKLVKKMVLTISSSPAFTGGVRCHAQLNETLLACGARVVLRPEAVIGAVHEKVKGGRLTDQQSLDFLLAGIDDLLADIRLPTSADKVA
jgi:chromate reductase, NAD(P)H dehydrogenase (quinone)